MQARRNNLNGESWGFKETDPEHAGLWLDRYLGKQLPRGQSVGTDEKTPPQQLVEEVSNIRVPDVYESYYQRWEESLKTRKDIVYREARVEGRMAVGLGAESVIETTVQLHHTYGVPFIPGSALKGLAASYAHQKLADERWRKGGDAHNVLFGSTKTAGFVTFYDALYVPGSGQPLYPDVITVHHPDYYQEGKSAPADWDSPNPVFFLSATGRYLIALGGDYPVWVNTAFDILGLALAEYGIGAKTSSGYGRLVLDRSASTLPTTTKVSADQTAAEPPTGYERGRIKTFGLGPSQSYGFIAPDGGGKDIFVHQSQLPPGVATPQAGQNVYFRRVHDNKGVHAEDVQLAIRKIN